MSTDVSIDVTTEVNRVPARTELGEGGERRSRMYRLDSEQGLLLMVGMLVLLGAAAILAVSGW